MLLIILLLFYSESLDVILKTVQDVASNLSTIGVALEPRYVPGADGSHTRQLGPYEIELGMGKYIYN